jgi:ATP-dependent DNA helicase PIF1
MEFNVFSPEQKHCFDIILNSIYGHTLNKNVFYVDGIGGSGKTFLYTTILPAIRSKGNLALAAASSGVASLLLPGGQTGHSLFKIPLKFNEFLTCSITKQSTLAKMLKIVKLIICDEAPMMHTNVF